MRIRKATSREKVANQCWECAGQREPSSHSLIHWRVDTDRFSTPSDIVHSGPHYLHRECLDKFKLRRMRYELMY